MRNEMFQELIENSNDIIVVTDRDFRVRYISSSVFNVFEIEPVSVVGKNIFDFIEREKADQWKENLKRASYPIVDEIAVSIHENEKIYFDVHLSNLLSHFKVQGLVIKLHDITKKKEKEKELIRSNKHLDQVIFKTTHDLKAPVRSALGLVQLAEEAPAGEKEEYIGLIKKTLLRLDSYIDEMNNFFRIEKLALQREHIDLGRILQEEQENLGVFLKDNRLKIFIKLDEELAWYSDIVRVRTIISNIFSNAIKYQDRRKSDPFVKIETKVTADFCDILIEDNGIGIAPEFQDRIFDLFFRATEQSQGSGLGLFIVKDTIERLNGSIEVRSFPGKGTSFLIRIPNQIHQPHQEVA